MVPFGRHQQGGVQKRPTRQTKVKDVMPEFNDENIFKTMQCGKCLSRAHCINKKLQKKDAKYLFRVVSYVTCFCAGERPITTLLLIKPGVASRHLSRLLKRIAHEGFRVVALRQLMLSEDDVRHIVAQNDQQVLLCNL